MECAVLKRFLKVQGTFSIKKFLQIPLSIWKKLNLIRFIKALLKDLPLIRFALLSTFSTGEKALKPFRQATLAGLRGYDFSSINFYFNISKGAVVD